MEKPNVSGRGWIWLRFLAGLGYLVVLAVVLSATTNIHPAATFAGLLAGAVVATTLGITWLALWARRKESQLGQFQIGSFFFLTALVAILFSAIRWTAARIISEHRAPADSTSLFVDVAIAWLVAAAVAVPLLLGMAEAVLWAGVWAIRQPLVRGAVRVMWPKLMRVGRGRPRRSQQVADVEPNPERRTDSD